MDNQDNFENPVNQDNQNTEVPPPISVKKENSYTYWVKNDPNHPKIDCQPKKVEDPNLIPQQQNTVHSAWNASGTWEERKLNLNDIKEALGQLQGLEIGTAKIAKTTSVSGEATYYFIRGKKRLGYHLKIEFELEEGGTIKYTDFTDDGDREFELDDVQNPTVKANIETLNSATLKVIEQFK